MNTETRVTPLARRLLTKTLRTIERSPKAYQQAFATTTYGPKTRPGCDSPVCIAGWMAWHRANELKRSRAFWASWNEANEWGHDLEVFATRRLGLTYAQFNALFSAALWPGRFARKFNARVTPRLGVARIKHFLKTGE